MLKKEILKLSNSKTLVHGGPGVARRCARRSTPRHLAVHRGFSTRCPRVLPNRPRTISLLPPSPSNRGYLSASTPSPSGLAPVYKSSLRRVSTDTDTDTRGAVAERGFKTRFPAAIFRPEYSTRHECDPDPGTLNLSADCVSRPPYRRQIPSHGMHD